MSLAVRVFARSTGGNTLPACDNGTFEDDLRAAYLGISADYRSFSQPARRTGDWRDRPTNGTACPTRPAARPGDVDTGGTSPAQAHRATYAEATRRGPTPDRPAQSIVGYVSSALSRLKRGRGD